MRALVFACACIALSATLRPAAAQWAPCVLTETVADCITRLEGREPRTAREAGASGERLSGSNAAAAQDRLQARSTGFGVGDLASSIGDFLPLFAGMLGGDAANADETMAVDVNLRLDFDRAHPGAQAVRVRVIRHAPALHQPLLDSIPEATRAARAATLADDLPQFSDVEVRAAFNLETGSFGRSFGQYRRLWSDLFGEITGAAERATLDGRSGSVAAALFLNDLPDTAFATGCDPTDAGDVQTLRLECLTNGPRLELMTLLRNAVVEETRLDSLVQDALRRRGFFRFADLVNNQPQLSIEAHWRTRKDLSGPDSFGGTLRFELGFANVNRFRAYCRREGLAVADGCLENYLAVDGITEALGRGDRLWLSVDLAHTAAYAFALPADAVALDEPRAWAVTASAGFGRYVGTSGDLEQGRVDLRADYVFRADDAVRENRLTGALTYSQRLSDAASLVLGVHYANKPEFLGEVDDKLSANFGIRYGISRGTED